MNVVFIGFKAVGKTTYGKAFAKEKNMPFIDLDSVITEIDGRKRKSREIYKTEGKDYFRELETKAIKECTSKDGFVISVGGGSLDREENRKLFKKLGRIIYLKDSKELLFERIKMGGLPPFIDKERPFESFSELFDKRKGYFESVADIVFDCDGKNPEEVIAKLVNIKVMDDD